MFDPFGWEHDRLRRILRREKKLGAKFDACMTENDALKEENERLLKKNMALELALSPEAVETLAAHCHNEQWTGWTRWMIDNWKPSSVERWERQLATSYEDLPDYDKESDRKEARRIIALLRGLVDARSLSRG